MESDKEFLDRVRDYDGDDFGRESLDRLREMAGRAEQASANALDWGYKALECQKLARKYLARTEQATAMLGNILSWGANFEGWFTQDMMDEWRAITAESDRVMRPGDAD
jgi:hypothetical protein